jgi:hypothetical protein
MAFRFSGQVDRLYVRGGTPNVGCMIRLRDVTPADATLPQDGYFYLDRDNTNYDALYSLALLAANGRHRLQVRTIGDAVPTEPAPISYLVVDW